MNSSDYRAFILILVLLLFCKKETISITVISVTFRDGDDGPDRCWPNMLILAHSSAIRSVFVGSGYNLLSNYAMKSRNKFYLICNSARSEMTLNKGTTWVFSQNANNL